LILIPKTVWGIENFGNQDKNIMGYEEGLPYEYRNIDYPKFKNQMWNTHEYKGNNWHLRFPYMINQRYSYNDNPTNCKTNPTIYNYAHLKELPLKFKNVFTLERNHKLDSYPLLIDTKYDIMPNRKNIYGFDYYNMNNSTINAGDGTSEDYYYMDRLNNRIY